MSHISEIDSRLNFVQVKLSNLDIVPSEFLGLDDVYLVLLPSYGSAGHRTRLENIGIKIRTYAIS